MQHIKVRAFPDAAREKIQVDGERFRVFVREPAQNGLANKRIQELVANHLGLSPNEIYLVNGHRSTNKTFAIRET